MHALGALLSHAVACGGPCRHADLEIFTCWAEGSAPSEPTCQCRANAGLSLVLCILCQSHIRLETISLQGGGETQCLSNPSGPGRAPCTGMPPGAGPRRGPGLSLVSIDVRRCRIGPMRGCEKREPFFNRLPIAGKMSIDVQKVKCGISKKFENTHTYVR